jgi:hypothetical protein
LTQDISLDGANTYGIIFNDLVYISFNTEVGGIATDINITDSISLTTGSDNFSVSNTNGFFSFLFGLETSFGRDQHTHETSVSEGSNTVQLLMYADDSGSGSTTSEWNVYSGSNIAQSLLNGDKGGINPTASLKAAVGGDYTEFFVTKQKAVFGGTHTVGVIGIEYAADYSAINSSNPRWVPTVCQEVPTLLKTV